MPWARTANTIAALKADAATEFCRLKAATLSKTDARLINLSEVSLPLVSSSVANDNLRLQLQLEVIMQNGSVIRRNRKKYSDIWQFRWWEKTSTERESIDRDKSVPDPRPGCPKAFPIKANDYSAKWFIIDLRVECTRRDSVSATPFSRGVADCRTIREGSGKRSLRLRPSSSSSPIWASHNPPSVMAPSTIRARHKLG
jgi:hypothetical protein